MSWRYLVSLAVAVCGVQAASAASLRLVSVQPTVFLVRAGDDLIQVADLVIENTGGNTPASVEARLDGKGVVKTAIAEVPQGQNTFQASVPSVDAQTPIEFVLRVDGKEVDRQKLAWQPQRHWEVCIVPVTHHDLGYTDTIENVLRKYDGYYDSILRFCSETDDFPEDSRYRYCVEGSWSLQHYLANRPKEAAEKIGKYMREGRIEVSALFGNELGAICSHEELIRLMYPSFRMKRELGASISTASITDIPGLSWGFPTVLAGAGVKYFFAGLPGYFQWGRSDVHDFWDEEAILPHGRPGAFRWEGPDGKSVLVYFQGGYGHFNGGIGPGSYEEVFKDLPGKLAEMEKQESPFSVVRYIHNGVDNYPPDVVISHLVKQWNERWAYPRLIVATNSMFFEKLEKQCGDVRTFRGELPDTDYVVGASSTARETGINRVAHDRLHSAEKFATIASLLAGSPGSPDAGFWITTHAFYPDVNRTLGEAYDNALLYDEHTWGMSHQAGTLQDWDWADKSRYAYKAAGLAESILGGGLGAITKQISLDEDGQHLVVFNSLSIPRTDVVRVSGKQPGHERVLEFAGGEFSLVDEDTGKDVAFQVVKLSSPQSAVPYAAQRFARGQFSAAELYELVFVAENVPPLGWKTYRMVPGKKEMPASDGVTVFADGLENRFFKITIDPKTGTISSVFDKELDRELVDADAPHKMNQFVARWVKDGQLKSPSRAKVARGQAGPVCGSLVVSASAAGCPQITQEVILYDGIKRIELANRVLKDSTPGVELYFAFPFNVENPDFRFEGTHSVIKPLRDQFPGSNSNYYAVQHWADASDGQAGVTLSAIDSHLLEFGGLHPCYVSQAHHGVTPPDFGHPFVAAEEMTRGHMYAFVLDANFRTNFPPLEQADLLFRYAITTHKGTCNNGASRDFGWSVGNPLVAVGVDGKQEGTLAKSMGFCQIEPAGVCALTFKRAEDGDGVILRLLECAGESVTASVTLPHLAIKSACRTNLVEENESDLPVSEHQLSVPVQPFETVTMRLRSK